MTTNTASGSPPQPPRASGAPMGQTGSWAARSQARPGSPRRRSAVLAKLTTPMRVRSWVTATWAQARAAGWVAGNWANQPGSRSW